MRYKQFSYLIMIMLGIILLCSSCDIKNNELLPLPPELNEPINKNIFTYNYNGATSHNEIMQVELLNKNLKDMVLPVPIRNGFSFNGWYADWFFHTRVSNEKGQVVIGDELYEMSNGNLYAKWTNDKAPVYSVLLVFVTKVDAQFIRFENNEIIDVQYVMTCDERKVCNLIVTTFEEYLNALLNGNVNFKVDTFFTTEPIGKYSFSASIGGTENKILYDYGVSAYTIPEIGGVEWTEDGRLPPKSEIEQDTILSKYGSIITTFNMNDYDNLLHCTAGSAIAKYAEIHMETLWGGIVRNGGTIDYLLNLDYSEFAQWRESWMDFYLHEFVHTVELYPENKFNNSIDFHDALNRYLYEHYGDEKNGAGQSGQKNIEFIRLYLLNIYETNGEKIGIPQEFWIS